jgi:hypothetical protein
MNEFAELQAPVLVLGGVMVLNGVIAPREPGIAPAVEEFAAVPKRLAFWLIRQSCDEVEKIFAELVVCVVLSEVHA